MFNNNTACGDCQALILAPVGFMFLHWEQKPTCRGILYDALLLPWSYPQKGVVSARRILGVEALHFLSGEHAIGEYRWEGEAVLQTRDERD
jgi:hypothetical protein